MLELVAYQLKVVPTLPVALNVALAGFAQELASVVVNTSGLAIANVYGLLVKQVTPAPFLIVTR